MARAKRAVRLAEVVGPVTNVDLIELETEHGTRAPVLMRPKAAHHNLARLLAAGHSVGDAASITGYCISRVSILQADPTFQELMKFYSKQQDEVFGDVLQLMKENAVDLLLEMRDRLENKPDEVTNSDLLAMLNAHLDRIGHAPVQKVAHAHVHASSDRLAALKAAADSVGNGQVRVVNRRVSTSVQTSDAAPALGSGEPVTLDLFSEPGSEGGGASLPGASDEALTQAISLVRLEG